MPNLIPEYSREAVYERSGRQCEALARLTDPPKKLVENCSRSPVALHHLEARRSRNHEPDNLIALCISCHNYVHANPSWSYEHELMVRHSR